MIAVFLGGWFVLTIWNQLTGRPGEWVRKINSYGFIPGWTFFAPTPGTMDYRLFYRDVFADGTTGVWQEVEWCRPRLWRDAVWHPRRYATKLILDCINGLSEVVHAMKKEGIAVEVEPQGMMLSTPYVVLLNFVMAFPKQSASSAARQMALFLQDPMADRGMPGALEKGGKLMLCSTAHALD